MRKNDWLLAGGILIAAFGLLFFRFLFGAEAGQVVVTVDGKEYGVYELAEDRTIEIGGTNRMVIKGGKVKMEWADCPDQICVDHREIGRDGESIICLPNKIVITVKSEDIPELDGIAQ